MLPARIPDLGTGVDVGRVTAKSGPKGVVLAALVRMKKRYPREALFSIAKLRAEVGGPLSGGVLDAGMADAMASGDVYLVEHDYPQGASEEERAGMLQLRGRWYNGIALRSK
jgi:hypothetical protein